MRPSSNIAPPGDGLPTPTAARSDLLSYMAQHLVYTKLLSRYCINLEPTLNPNSGRFGHGAELRLRHCLEREQCLGDGLGIAPRRHEFGTGHHTPRGDQSHYGEPQSRTPPMDGRQVPQEGFRAQLANAVGILGSGRHILGKGGRLLLAAAGRAGSRPSGCHSRRPRAGPPEKRRPDGSPGILLHHR